MTGLKLPMSPVSCLRNLVLCKRGRQCFANGNVKVEFVLKCVCNGEDAALSVWEFSERQHSFLSKKRTKTFNFRNVPRSVICGEWPISVSGQLAFCVCNWVFWICLFFSLNPFSTVIYNFYMKTHCNLKLGTWHSDNVNSKLLWIVEDGSELTLTCKKLGFWQINASLYESPWKTSNQPLCPLYSPSPPFFPHFFWLKAIYKHFTPC